MICIDPNSPDYDAARQISNARFDYRPAEICYCENVDDVRRMVQGLAKSPAAIRVRSGGHHHEGMCTADGVRVIDVSKICHVLPGNEARHRARIGAGAALEAVYRKTLAAGLVFPGGGCGDVHAGGLVQGGGWGPYLRHSGLTCDRLVGIQIVTADGEVREVSDREDDPDGDLLWAVRGGGGGNFGVITEFCFSLDEYREVITRFTVGWADRGSRGPVAGEWAGNFSGATRALTTFCRLTVIDDAGSEAPAEEDFDDMPALIGGYFLGDEAELLDTMAQLLPTTFSRKTRWLAEPVTRGVAAAGMPSIAAGSHPHYQPGPPRSAPGGWQGIADTCAGVPFPHKVSSTFPRKDPDAALVQAATDFLDESAHNRGARQYLSLHGMGGAASDKDNHWSAFAFREKPFMLQYQAWWADRHDQHLGDCCMEWIRNFRNAMGDHTEGAFINFPDKDLVADPDTPDGRRRLLAHYYGDTNLDRLIGIKERYDHDDLFHFGMSIPTA